MYNAATHQSIFFEAFDQNPLLEHNVGVKRLV